MYEPIAQGCGVAQNTSRDVGWVYETLGFPRNHSGTRERHHLATQVIVRDANEGPTPFEVTRGRPRRRVKFSISTCRLLTTEPPHGGLNCDNAPTARLRGQRRGHTSRGRVPSDSQADTVPLGEEPRASAGTAGRVAGQRSGHVLPADCEGNREERAEQDAMAAAVPRVPMSSLLQGWVTRLTIFSSRQPLKVQL